MSSINSILSIKTWNTSNRTNLDLGKEGLHSEGNGEGRMSRLWDLSVRGHTGQGWAPTGRSAQDHVAQEWGVGGVSGDELGMTFRICRALSAGGGPCTVPSLVQLGLWPTWQLQSWAREDRGHIPMHTYFKSQTLMNQKLHFNTWNYPNCFSIFLNDQ